MNRVQGFLKTASIVVVVSLAACGGPSEEVENGEDEAMEEPIPSVQARLVADVTAIEAGGVFKLGVRFTLPPRAHIYWRNPGDSGLATGIEWSLPEGFEIGALNWPNPLRFEMADIEDISYGYSGETFLFAEVKAPAGLSPGASITLKADPYWLVCLEDGQCIPDGIGVEIELVVGAREASDAVPDFARYGRRTPRPASDAPITLVLSGDTPSQFTVHSQKPWTFLESLKEEGLGFFPDDGPAWDVIEAESSSMEGRASLTFQRQAGSDGAKPRGVLTLPLSKAGNGERRTFYLRVGESGQSG